MSNSLDPDQARHFVGPNLGPNCSQMLSAEDTIIIVLIMFYFVYFQGNPIGQGGLGVMYLYGKGVDRVFKAKPLFSCFTSQSTIFQSCRDNFLSSWVEPGLSNG